MDAFAVEGPLHLPHQPLCTMGDPIPALEKDAHIKKRLILHDPVIVVLGVLVILIEPVSVPV